MKKPEPDLSDRLPDEPQTVKLRTPVKHGEQLMSELVFRPLVGRDLRDMPAQGESVRIGDLMDIASKMAALPPSIMDQLCAEDLTLTLAVVNGFLLRIQNPLPGGTH
jgi:hypothetical protein